MKSPQTTVARQQWLDSLEVGDEVVLCTSSRTRVCMITNITETKFMFGLSYIAKAGINPTGKRWIRPMPSAKAAPNTDQGDRLFLKPRSRVAALRSQAGLNQTQLAVFVGVTSNTVQNWEKPAGLHPLERYIRLAAILGCSVEGLIEFVQEDEADQVKEFSLAELRELHNRWQLGSVNK